MKFTYLFLLSTVLSSGLVFSNQASALTIDKRAVSRLPLVPPPYYRTQSNKFKRDVQIDQDPNYEKREPQRGSSSGSNLYRGGGNPGSKREVQDQKDNEKREPQRGSSDGSNLYRGGGNPGSKREVQDQKDNEKREPQRGSSSGSNLYRGGGNPGSKRE
ncbi:15282_t:CDS:1, partial [Dentiscutata erythropus]